MAADGAWKAICMYEEDLGEGAGTETNAEEPQPSQSGVHQHASSSADSSESSSGDYSDDDDDDDDDDSIDDEISSPASALSVEEPSVVQEGSAREEGSHAADAPIDREAVRSSANAPIPERFWQEAAPSLESVADADAAVEWHVRPPPAPTEKANGAHVWLGARSLTLQKKKTKCRGPMRFVAHDVILRIGGSERIVPSVRVRLQPPAREEGGDSASERVPTV